MMKFTGERYLPSVDGFIALQHLHRYYFALEQIDLRGKKILDIACGEGYGCEILSKVGEHVYGVDISEETIQNAKKKYKQENITFFIGETSKIPLPESSVDVVVSFETIEHHDQHEEMLSEIKRVLTKDGVLIISSPDKGYYERQFPGYQNQFHVKELYSEEFKSLLEKYFKFSTYFLQNNICGSMIANENAGVEYKRPVLLKPESGNFQIIEPRFNLAISSNKEYSFSNSITFSSHSIIQDPYAVIKKQQEDLAEIYASKSYKLGLLIAEPYRRIRKLFNK